MTSELTDYGFKWGPMNVQRACSDGRYHTLLIQTKRWDIQLSVSPSGRAVHVVKLKRPAVGKSGEHD